MPATDRLSGLETAVAIKAPCRVATTANITLSGEQTIDGIAVVTGNRVLVKDQSTTTENGIYVASTGAWTRAVDFNGSRDAAEGTIVGVTNGTANGGKYFRQSTANPIPGSTAITFAAALIGFDGAGGTISGNWSFASPVTFPGGLVVPDDVNAISSAQGVNTAAINVLKEIPRLTVASGSAGAYAINAATTISAYSVGQVFTFIANHTSVGGGSDTLNVDGQGAVVLKKYDGATTKADIAAGDLNAGTVVMVSYDGVNFVVINSEFGVLDEDDFASDSATRPPSQQSAAAYIEGRHVGGVRNTPSRAFATSYQNNQGRDMIVAVIISSSATAALSLELSQDNATFFPVHRQTVTTPNQVAYSTTVPVGFYYRVTTTAGTGVINGWTEVY